MIEDLLKAWRNALLATLVGCLWVGGGLGWLGPMLVRRMDLYHAAVWLQVSFGVGSVAILAAIVAWQRARGASLAELGWRRPTSPWAIGLALALGALFMSGCYYGAQRMLPGTNVMELTWTRVALVPVGLVMAVAEEMLMRGVFMTELARARVAAWVQIIATGACSAVYHAFQNPSLEGYLPSFVLFSLHGGLYVLGRRSLTAPILAHAIYNVLGEPYLLMMALAVIKT